MSELLAWMSGNNTSNMVQPRPPHTSSTLRSYRLFFINLRGSKRASAQSLGPREILLVSPSPSLPVLPYAALEMGCISCHYGCFRASSLYHGAMPNHSEGHGRNSRSRTAMCLSVSNVRNPRYRAMTRHRHTVELSHTALCSGVHTRRILW